MHMTHTEFLIEPYLVLLLNILRRLIFVKLSRHAWFYHYEDLDDFTGQVYFMMIIYACNTPATINIEGTEKAFTNISLNDFPGENISDISTTSLRRINVMRGAYYITLNLSQLFS